MFEELIEEFITGLQWDLRTSYNSSSCLNSKQENFLKDKLETFVQCIREKSIRIELGE